MRLRNFFQKVVGTTSEISVTEENENYMIRYWKYKVVIPKDLLYSKETNFWIKKQDNIVEVGYTDAFQQLMGDIVAVELPLKGSADEIGEIESMKAAMDIVPPVSGTIIDVNEAVKKDPYLINQEPYTAWLFRIKPSNWEESQKYLQAAADYLKEVLKIIEAQAAKRKK